MNRMFHLFSPARRCGARSLFQAGLALLLSAAALASTACSSSGEPLPGGAAGGGESGHPSLIAVKRLVGFIRYERDDRALELIGREAITDYLLGASASSASAAQKTQFQELLGEYLKLKAFPTARGYFEDIDLAYAEPVVDGKTARIRSSIVYAGSERLSFTWVLTEIKGNWLVTDFLNDRGQSTMQSSRDQQIQPILRREGMDGLLKRFESIVADLRD